MDPIMPQDCQQITSDPANILTNTTDQPDAFGIQSTNTSTSAQMSEETTHPWAPISESVSPYYNSFEDNAGFEDNTDFEDNTGFYENNFLVPTLPGDAVGCIPDQTHTGFMPPFPSPAMNPAINQTCTEGYNSANSYNIFQGVPMGFHINQFLAPSNIHTTLSANSYQPTQVSQSFQRIPNHSHASPPSPASVSAAVDSPQTTGCNFIHTGHGFQGMSKRLRLSQFTSPSIAPAVPSNGSHHGVQASASYQETPEKALGDQVGHLFAAPQPANASVHVSQTTEYNPTSAGHTFQGVPNQNHTADPRDTPAPTTGVEQLTVKSYADAMLVKSILVSQRDDPQPRDLVNFPATDAERQVRVLRIKAAMKSKHNAVDATRAGGAAPSQASAFLTMRSEQEFDVVSWELLFAVRDAQMGRYGLVPWASDKLYPDMHFASFDERLGSVVEALEISKAMCKNLFDAYLSFASRLAMNPDDEISKKHSNAKTNRARDHQVKTYNLTASDAEKAALRASIQSEKPALTTSRKRKAS